MPENMFEITLVICVTILLILFSGSPDLMDHLTGNVDCTTQDD